MNRKWSQVLWLLSAILLIGAGVICIMNPMTALSSIAWIIAIAILFEGFSDIVGYFFFRDTFFSNAWMLIDGILSVVMACFLIGYNDITAAFIPYIFSGWLLVTSLAKFINSFQMRRFNFASWNCRHRIFNLCLFQSVAGNSDNQCIAWRPVDIPRLSYLDSLVSLP